jgi:hypothetical protein
MPLQVSNRRSAPQQHRAKGDEVEVSAAGGGDRGSAHGLSVLFWLDRIQREKHQYEKENEIRISFSFLA